MVILEKMSFLFHCYYKFSETGKVLRKHSLHWKNNSPSFSSMVTKNATQLSPSSDTVFKCSNMHSMIPEGQKNITTEWCRTLMHSSAIFQAPLISVIFYCPCEKVDHKQEVSFFCTYYVRLSSDTITLIHRIKIDNVLL